MTYEWQGEITFTNPGRFSQFQSDLEVILAGAALVPIGEVVNREQQRRNVRTIIFEATTEPSENAVAVFNQVVAAAQNRQADTSTQPDGERGSYMILRSKDWDPVAQEWILETLASWP
jgi:hypothetical protein